MIPFSWNPRIALANVLLCVPMTGQEAIKALADVLQSPEIKAFLEEEYEGSCVLTFLNKEPGPHHGWCPVLYFVTFISLPVLNLQ